MIGKTNIPTQSMQQVGTIKVGNKLNFGKSFCCDGSLSTDKSLLKYLPRDFTKLDIGLGVSASSLDYFANDIALSDDRSKGVIVSTNRTWYFTSSIGNRSISTNATNLQTVAYGKDLFVAGASTGGISTSTDGNIWNQQTTVSSPLNKIIYKNELFVGVGNNGIIVTSENGIAWNVRSSNTTENLLGIDYGGGKFVAVGENGTILMSVNGIVWTNVSPDTTFDIISVCYGANRFIASVKDENGLFKSTDGKTWSLSTTYPNVNFARVFYYDGLFISSNLNGLMTSTDSETWEYNNNSWLTGDLVNGIAIVNNYIYLLSTRSSIVQMKLNSGIFEDKTFKPSVEASTFIGIAYSGQIWCAVYWNSSSQLYAYTSNDLKTWSDATLIESNYTDQVYYFGYVGDSFIISYKSSDIYMKTSVNGVDWQNVNVGNRAVRDVTYNNGTYVAAVSSYNGIYYSKNGINWSSTTASAAPYSCIISVNNMFMGFSNTGIATSSDGETWTRVAATCPVRLVAYGDGKFYGAISGARTADLASLYESTDGINWTFLKNIPNVNKVNQIVYTNGTIAVLGRKVGSSSSDSLYITNDGTNWELFQFDTYKMLTLLDEYIFFYYPLCYRPLNQSKLPNYKPTAYLRTE